MIATARASNALVSIADHPLSSWSETSRHYTCSCNFLPFDFCLIYWYSLSHMINAEVIKSGSESALSTIRKFSRKVQGTGLIRNSRKRRYYERDMSKAVKKKRALKRIKRHTDFRKLVKEGKAEERQQRRSFRDAAPTPRPATTGSGLGENTPIAR